MGGAQACCADDVAGDQRDAVDPRAATAIAAAATNEEIVDAKTVPIKQAEPEPPNEPIPQLTSQENEVATPLPPPPKAEEPSTLNPGDTPGQVEFIVVLKKTPTNQRLGMAVDIGDGVCLIVDKIDGGIAQAWNEEKTNSPEEQIQPGDKVVTVNGVSGDAVQITQVCKRDDVLELKIVRSTGA